MDIHPCLEWDPNPRSQCSKTFRMLDRAATVIGNIVNLFRLDKQMTQKMYIHSPASIQFVCLAIR
jgi:hypothetical protein